MEPLTRQLEELKRKLARIDAKYAAAPAPAPAAMALEGREASTAAGVHWEMDRLWPAQARHGSADIGALCELPDDLLVVLDPETAAQAPCYRWAFLDTETTGLAGGAGTAAFLTGVGWISPRGFELRQYFLRDHGEEASALTALAELLGQFDVLITYNGRAFDQPLLETRYVLSRIRPPFARMKHIDLLYAARRLWRLALESCRLKELEKRILGVERVGDPDGALIPQLYFTWLRSRHAGPLQPVFEHNALDILSLACLTAVVPMAFQNPRALRQGAEMAGLSRWLANEGRLEEAAALLRESLQRPMTEALVWESLWRLAELERKLGRHDAALAAWSELSTARNPWQAQAYERLAIHFEHRERNYAMALEMTRAALALEPGDELRKREARLRDKAGRGRPGRLL
jgi:tetratricopeptide (TPR) repeat protein